VAGAEKPTSEHSPLIYFRHVASRIYGDPEAARAKRTEPFKFANEKKVSADGSDAAELLPNWRYTGGDLICRDRLHHPLME
jgi:hypothetical protein